MGREERKGRREGNGQETGREGRKGKEENRQINF